MDASAHTPTQNFIGKEARWGARNYQPVPVVVDHARDCLVWDVEGRRYIDMMGAYSAVSHGHLHPRIVAAALADLCGKDLVLPMNTGAEAVETGIKTARAWAYRVKGVAPDAATIVVANGNFHGRTTTIVGFSDDPTARDGFGPFTPGFISVPYGDAAAIEAAIDENTAAVLIEPIQGEAGVIIPPEGYLKAVRDICTRNNVLFIADEIQSGLGRVGTTFACDREGVVPDVYLMGKALGGGILAVSAIAADRDVLGVIQPGEHGSTFGGNPLAAAVGLKVVEMLATGEYQERAVALGEHLKAKLDELVGHGVTEVRAAGLWAGVDVDPAVGTGREVAERLLARGVLVKDTHGQTIRIAPPLTIRATELDWAIEQLKLVLDD
jgi:ornithine--oxo-acid transaminase